MTHNPECARPIFIRGMNTTAAAIMPRHLMSLVHSLLEGGIEAKDRPLLHNFSVVLRGQTAFFLLP